MKRYVIFLAAAMALAGCKEFLEPYSQTEYSPTRVDQLSELILSGLPDPVDNGHAALTGGMLDILSDDVQTRRTINVINPAVDLWYAQGYVSAVQALYTWQADYSSPGRWTPEYTRWDRVYKDTYYKLVYVNSVLDYVDRVSGTDAQKDYVRAQALALRAFYYLNLVNIYGEPYASGRGGQGVPIRLTGAKENRKMTRNTVGEVYDRIADDLLTAIALFDRMPASEQFRDYRPTLPMSLLLLARTCLYMENWERAEFYADRLVTEWPRFEVLDLNTLVAANTTNFDPSTPWRQFFRPDFMTTSNPEAIWVYGAAADAVSLTANDMSGGARVVNGEVYAMLTLASDGLIDSFDPADLRLRTYLVRNMFDYNGSRDPSTFTYRAYGKQKIGQNATGLADNTNRFLPSTEYNDFGYALRISEAWLILAEARAEQGDDPGALAALDAVQSRRFSGSVPAAYNSGGPTIDLVRAERRRELCFEAHRWFDLRRWGMPEIRHVWYDTTIGSQSGTALTYILEQGDPGYTLPMPYAIMNENADLTQVPVDSNRNPQ